MNKWMQLSLALAIAGALACDRGDRAANDRAAGTGGTAATTGRVVDGDFIGDQLADGEAEVELGKLAQERGSHPDVKEFGAMMVRDHQRAGAELKQIASQHNLQPDQGRHEDHNEMRERLSKLSGADFDREYINAMVDDHAKAVDDVKGKAETSDNPEVKRWAASTLPSLQQHLERAKQLQSQLRDAGERNR